MEFLTVKWHFYHEGNVCIYNSKTTYREKGVCRIDLELKPFSVMRRQMKYCTVLSLDICNREA